MVNCWCSYYFFPAQKTPWTWGKGGKPLTLVCKFLDNTILSSQKRAILPLSDEPILLQRFQQVESRWGNVHTSFLYLQIRASWHLSRTQFRNDAVGHSSSFTSSKFLSTIGGCKISVRQVEENSSTWRLLIMYNSKRIVYLSLCQPRSCLSWTFVSPIYLQFWTEAAWFIKLCLSITRLSPTSCRLVVIQQLL